MFYSLFAGTQEVSCLGNLPEVSNLGIHFSRTAILTPPDAEFSGEAIASEAMLNTEALIYQDLDLTLTGKKPGNGQYPNLE